MKSRVVRETMAAEISFCDLPCLLMRMVRSIKSDDSEDWCKEADFKFKMLRVQDKNKQYYCCFLFSYFHSIMRFKEKPLPES